MERATKEKLMKAAAAASVLTAGVLFTLKLLAWWLSGSVAMLASLTDSALDIFASLVTLVAVKTALIPADNHHRFGHGKVEPLAALLQSAVMAGSALFVMVESMERLFIPAAVSALDIVVYVSLSAIVLTVLLVAFEGYVARRSGSLAIAADQMHYKGDIAMNIGVILGALLVMQGYGTADAVLGMIIALYILHSARAVVLPAIHMLMDHELPEENQSDILEIASSVSGVEDVHDLRTRQSGIDVIIQLHVAVAGDLTVQAGHAIGDAVRAALQDHFQNADILIHIDPEGYKTTVDNEAMRSKVST